MTSEHNPTPRTSADIEAELASIDNAIQSKALESDAPPAADPAEADASRKGWVPKDKYTGDPAKWVDAKTFIERGEKFNANLQREIAALKSQIQSFEGTKKAFAKFHEETIARKDAEMKEAIAALRVQRSAAIREGDDEGAVALEDRIETLRTAQSKLKEMPAVQDPPAAPIPVDPVIEEWIEDGNTWFRDDPKLQRYAVSLGEDLIKKGETLRGRKFLDKVAALMAEEFPRKFKTADTSSGRNTTVEGNSAGKNQGGGGGGKTERDLPPEDLALMRQFVKEGWTTKEKFLKSYFKQ